MEGEKECLPCEAKANLSKDGNFGLCVVCIKIRKDYSEKKINYCTLCKVWMCDSCRVNYLSRGFAFIKTILNIA